MIMMSHSATLIRRPRADLDGTLSTMLRHQLPKSAGSVDAMQLAAYFSTRLGAALARGRGNPTADSSATVATLWDAPERASSQVRLCRLACIGLCSHNVVLFAPRSHEHRPHTLRG